MLQRAAPLTWQYLVAQGHKSYLGSALQPVASPDLDEITNGVSQILRPEVIPEDAGRSRVSHDVGISLVQVVVGKGPVVESGSRVVILDESHSSGGPHAKQAWGAPLAIYQSPVFPSAHRLLQDSCKFRGIDLGFSLPQACAYCRPAQIAAGTLDRSSVCY